MKDLKIRFNIVIGETETIELLALERTELNAGNIGLTLADAKMLLRNGQNV